jgi:hypothetical protein
MKTAVIALAFLLLGAVLGGFAALGFGVSMGTASGLVMGSQAGVCLAIETAKKQGLLSPEAGDRVVVDTVGQIRSRARNLPHDSNIKWAHGEADCAKMTAEMDARTVAPHQGSEKKQ